MKKMRLLAVMAVSAIMAANVVSAGEFVAAPTNWIPGYTSDGTNMSIPIASLSYLSAAQADSATGDVRQIVFAIEETIYQKWITIPSTNRSGRISVSRTSVAYTNRISHTYSYRADLTPVSLVVMPE